MGYDEAFPTTRHFLIFVIFCVVFGSIIGILIGEQVQTMKIHGDIRNGADTTGLIRFDNDYYKVERLNVSNLTQADINYYASKAVK